MSIRDLPIIDGKITVPFGKGQLTRASVAFSPDNGGSYRNHKPRLAPSRLPKFKVDLESLYKNIIAPNSFDPNTTPFMYYDINHGGPKYLYGPGGREAQFESQFPEFDVLTLGMSTGSATFQKPIIAYRLTQNGAADVLKTKHCVITCAVHGNEVDGVDGAFKACEILARSPLFQNFRDEWTLLFIPAMNPDGWYNELRNLEAIGPNGRTVNLNRQFDWFWAEYAETPFESKGAAPFSTNEAAALENYRLSLNAGLGGRFGALLDCHATSTGVGSRYQSRDRIWRDVQYGLGEGGQVPDNYLTIPLDYYIWKLHHTVDACRTRDLSPGDPGFDKFTRYYRSRMRPHLHAYSSSLGTFSMAIEDVKAANSNGQETPGSACNFRLDYILTFAAAITTDNWEFEDAILIEKETENILKNADWAGWQDDSRVTGTPQERPSYYSLSRASVERTTVKTGEKFYNDGGEAVLLTTDTDIKLSAASQYLNSTNDTSVNAELEDVWGTVTITYNSGGVGNIHKIPADEWKAGDLFPGGLVVHTTPVGASIVYTGQERVHVLGGGTIPFVGASSLVTEINTNIDTPAETPIVPNGPWVPRMHAGCADNFLSFAVANKYGYIVGGHDGVSTFYNDLGIWDSSGGLGSPNTWIPSLNTLPTAVAGPGVVYNPNDGQVYIFGGLAAPGVPVSTVHIWNPIPDVLSLAPIALPKPLAFMGAVFNPGTGKIYLYGGETTGGAFSSDIYEFDPVLLTFTIIEPIENISDDENIQVEGGEGAPWQHQWGRMGAATFMETATDEGKTVLVGGQFEDVIGLVPPVLALTDGAYQHTFDDNTLGLVRIASFGYIRRSTKIDFGFIDQVTEDFSAASAEFEDPNSNWTIASGVATSSATGGPLKLTTVPEYLNEQVECTVRMTGVTSVGDFALIARATYNGANLTDGYRLRYTDGTSTWTLERLISGVPIILGTHVAGAGEQITTTARLAKFTIIDRNPVRLVAEMNSTEILDVYDLNTNRITDTGITAIEGQSVVDDLEIDDFVLRTSGLNEELFAASVMAQSHPTNVSGYVRSTFYPKDDSNLDGNAKFVTRRVRNYYTMPPPNMYWWYRERLDLHEGTIKHLEDGFRYYVRAYNNDQKVYFDGVHVHKGSLIASSFQHPDFPRAAEVMTFADALNIDTFRLKFRWMPTAGFPDLYEDIELAKIQLNAGNYIALVAKAGERKREFNANDIHGPHDPVFELQKRRTAEPCWNQEEMFNVGGYNESGPCGAQLEQSIQVVSYWGYDLRDPSMEREDEVIEFTITHFANKLLELRVSRFGSEGNAGTVATGAFASPTNVDIIYNGFGYYSQPEIMKTEDLDGRKLPIGRKGLLARRRSIARGQFFTGDRDPSSGEMTIDIPYFTTEDFDRIDDSNLGENWDIQKQTGNGFDIHSNKARCSQEGFERWDPRPKHTDIILKADVAVNNTSDRVGVLARWTTDASDITAYSAELIQTGTSSAEVRIIRWHLGIEEILASQVLSSYTSGEELELIFTLEGPTLEAVITGRATTTAIDTNYIRPQRVGIYGTTGGPTQYVTVDNFRMEPNFKMFITE